ncbi:MAG: hypothetical protein JRH01_03695 [Deltaproteobacteria bacterium]|nr:hypothetical protein [Deltaproteobacteria bacterium]MBW2394767.1 hypothetical protein [Deltaproteobacteria bacterium]
MRDHDGRLPAERVGHDASGDLQHQRSEVLGRAEHHELEGGQLGDGNQVEARDEPPSAVEDRPQEDPAEEDGGDVARRHPHEICLPTGSRASLGLPATEGRPLRLVLLASPGAGTPEFNVRMASHVL